MKNSSLETQQDIKIISMLRQNINNIESTLQIIPSFKTNYSHTVLEEELTKLKSQLSEMEARNNGSKKFALISIKNLMEKFPVSFNIEDDTDKWHIINAKIDKFENDYKTKGYYGVGSVSIPSSVDGITYKYCCDTFQDVYEEVSKQIKTFA